MLKNTHSCPFVTGAVERTRTSTPCGATTSRHRFIVNGSASERSDGEHIVKQNENM